MSTRKRGRPSLNAHDDEDELSPSKPTSAPLSAAKKRKLNTYGSNRTDVLGKLVGLFGLSRSEKENANAADEKDELANEDGEREDEQEMMEKDIWEIPDDEEVSMKSKGGRRDGAPRTPSKGTPSSRGKGMTGSVRSSNKAIDEVYDSEEDRNVAIGARKRGDSNVDGTPHIAKSASKVNNEDEGNGTARRGRGRPPKHHVTVAPSPMKSPGKPRKSDILKKAKKLSREAAFQAMVEAGQRRAAEESVGTATRRRSGRSNAEAEVKEVEDSAEVTEEVEEADVARPKGRPKKDRLDGFKVVPSGIITPTKDRILKAKKSVAFERREDINLGFKDIPDSASRASTSKSRKTQDVSHEDTEESSTSIRRKKQTDPATNIVERDEEDEEDADDVACAVCNGLDSKKGNEIILCDNENTCDFAVHLRCYGLSKVPKGEWLCRDCQPGEDEDMLGLEVDGDIALGEVFDDLPEIEGLEDHLRHMQRVLLDRLTGQRRIKLRGHDEEIRKVHQVVEQTVLAGEGNSMLIIGARGCGKTTVGASTV